MLARCDASGALLATKGRVEIRYRPTDGKAYQAGIRNLVEDPDGTLLPDDHCAEAAPAERATAKTKSKASSKSPSKSKADATTAGAAPPAVAKDGEVIAYADGACSGNPGPAGLGVVWIDSRQRRELSEYLGPGTNNIAELTGILRVAEAVVDGRTPVRVYTDSRYCIGVLTQGWKAKANQELIAKTKRVLSRLDDFELHYVPGHAGVPLNERADELAVQAVRTKKSTGWIDL